MRKLIIIRGNSGSGKTTLAKALQLRLGRNVMLISQDTVRREMLNARDGFDTKALPLLKELILYGSKNCEIVILEGILNSKWYKSLFELAKEEYKDDISAYYYDIPFEETIRRHKTRACFHEFGEKEMKSWWNEKDFIGIIDEKVLNKNLSLETTVELIIGDINEINNIEPESKERTVSLVPMTRELLHIMYKNFTNDPDIFDKGFHEYKYDKERINESFDRDTKDKTRKIFAICLEGNPIPLGEIKLKYIDLGNKECTMSIHLTNDTFKNKGYGTKAEKLALKTAFEKMGMKIVYADAILKNKRSQHVLEKAGFKYIRQDDKFKYYKCELFEWQKEFMI